MELIQKWFFKQQHRQGKFVSLYDMMFDGCDVSYLSYRLSLFNLQVLFHFFSHMVLFYFMLHKLALKTFTLLVLVSALKMLVSAGWWGGLEVLRTQVRQAYQMGQKEEVNRAIGFWLILSGLLAIPFLLIALFYGYQTYTHFIYHQPLIQPIFITFTLLSLVVQLPLGAYHAGIYGISRIMRPRFSMILPYLIGLCILLFSWSLFKQYAILLSLIGESVTSLILTYYYTNYMYTFYKVVPIKPMRLDFRTRFMQLPFLNFLLGSLANIFIMSDALLILGFYFFAYGDMKQLLFIQIIFLISPLIRASSDWARLFYFDRKQLENEHLSIFITQYEKSVSRVASFLGFCFGIFATVASYLLISPIAAMNTLMMVPFFLMRSLVANRQVRAFTYYYYYDVIVSGLLMALSLIGIYRLEISLPEKGIIIAVSMIIVNAFLKRYRLPCCLTSHFQKLYTNLYNWLSNLSQSDGHIELYKLTVDNHATPPQKMNFIRRLTKNFQIPGEQVCVFGEYPILFFRMLKEGDAALTEAAFVVLGNGIVNKVEKNQINSIDVNFYQIPILEELTKHPLNTQGNVPDFSVEMADLINRFITNFPRGIYYNPDRHLGTEAKQLSYETVRRFNSFIWEYLFQRHKGRRASDVDLSLFFAGGQVRIVFVIPYDEQTEEHYQNIREWHNYLHAVNIMESLGIPNEAYTD